MVFSDATMINASIIYVITSTLIQLSQNLPVESLKMHAWKLVSEKKLKKIIRKLHMELFLGHLYASDRVVASQCQLTSMDACHLIARIAMHVFADYV